jgi:hypothetical protein
MDFLTDPKIADKPVHFIVETQLLLRPYLEGRQAMHLLYKVCRADNPEALWNDFRSDAKIETRSYDVVQKDALAELESCLETGDTVDLNHHHGDIRGATQLWTAAEKGHLAVVQNILQQPNIDPNQVRTKTRTTPLYIAAYHGHVEVVKSILAHPRVNVNSGNVSSEMSPLNKAVQLGREEVVKVLLRAKDIDVNQAIMSTGVSPLIKACEMGHEYIVELLLASSDIDVNYTLHDGSTALSVATHKGQDKIRDMLLAHPRIDSSAVNMQPQLIAAVGSKGPAEAGISSGDNTRSCDENAPVVAGASDAIFGQGAAAVDNREPAGVVLSGPSLNPDAARFQHPMEKAIRAALEIQRLHHSRLLAIATQLGAAVEIKERALGSRSCPPCFVGSEAVEVLIALGHADTIKEAEILGDQLAGANLTKQIVGVNGFRNQEQLFYVFSDLVASSRATVSLSCDVGSSSAAPEGSQVRPSGPTSEVPKVKSKAFKLSSTKPRLTMLRKNPKVVRNLQPLQNKLGPIEDALGSGRGSASSEWRSKSGKVKPSMLFDVDGDDDNYDDGDDVGAARRPWRHTITKHPPSRWEFESDQDFLDAKHAFESTMQLPPLKHIGPPMNTVSASAMQKSKSSATSAQGPPSKSFKLSSIDRNLESSLKEQDILERRSSEVPAVNVGGTKELRLKANKSKAFKLSSIDRNLESSLKEKDLLERL